jgi:hypothetical protein
MKLLVIAPQSFDAVLRPFIAHKNQSGLPARLVTLESLRASMAGADDPEKVKRAIAQAHQKLGARYVMLVGDASLMPVRYRQVQQVPSEATADGTYNPSELYYANLYQGHLPGSVPTDPVLITNSGVFDTWDRNGNGRYNEQHWKDDAISYNPDQVDGCPDVAVGRIPAHTAQEVENYVAKVIRYETGAAGPRKIGRVTLLADKGYGGSQQMCDDILDDSIKPAFPQGIAVERLYMNCQPAEVVSPPWTRGSFAGIDAAIANSWWITYLGHSGPLAWNISEAGHGYDAERVRALAKPSALPVIFTIGCESGRFMTWAASEKYRDQQRQSHWFVWQEKSNIWQDQVTGQTTKPQLKVPQPYAYDFPESRDRTFACAWLLQPGGAIAFFGETLVCEDDKGHDLVKELFLRYKAGDRVLGDLWRNGQRKYWLNNRASENVFRHPRIYLGIMTLFGDPSLRLPPGTASGP